MIIAEIESRIQSIQEMMNKSLDQGLALFDPETTENLENHFQGQARELADLMSASQIQLAVESDEMKQAVRNLIKLQPGRYKNCGLRRVSVRFAGGTVIALKMAYYARSCDKNKPHKGLYPALLLLGIHDRCTPKLASEVSQLSAALCSLEEAKQMLDNRGCRLNIKVIRQLVKRFAARARVAQESDLQLSRHDAKSIEGRKVVVSTDGGRIRIRVNKRGPKTKKGRRRYKTDWREPKLLIIYLTDKSGKLDKTFSPYIDGTLNGPDAIFGLITYYLTRIGVTSADKLLFVSDGALWIWERVSQITTALGLKSEQIYELIDFYHVVEHLNDLAKLIPNWSQPEREKWVRLNRRRLKKGKVGEVIANIKDVCKGTRKKLLKRERDYFIKNQHRLCYGDIADQQMPIGSGAVESSIRRVINLRLKGPCIFWHEDTANEVLMLRSYYKAGRWDTLKAWAVGVVA